MRHRLTARAERDVEGILRETRDLFGDRQVLAYAGLIDKAVAMAADDPLRPASRPRPELGRHIRSLHIELAARRRGASAHIVYYTVRPIEAEDTLVVLRVLHEAMEPARRVLRLLV